MFDKVRDAILRDMGTAVESKYADGPRDALVQHYLLLQVCERLDALVKGPPPLFSPPADQDRKAILARVLQTYPQRHQPIFPQNDLRVQQEPGAWLKLRQKQEAQQHTGIMIAFLLDPLVAQQLAIPHGEDPSDLHITLCYLGDGTPFHGDIEQYGDVELLKATVAKFAESVTPPLSGQTGGIGYFAPSEQSDNLAPVVSLVNVPGLQEFRRKLAEMLDSAGIFVANNFDYLPHITLAYADPGWTLPLDHLPSPVQLTFDTIWLCIGDERIAYPLGKLADQTYYYKIEILDKDGNVLHEANPATTQSLDPEPVQSTRPDKEAGLEAISAIHSENDTGDGGSHSATEEATAPQDGNRSFRRALINVATKAIKGATPAGTIEEAHLTHCIAQIYLEAQRHAYNKALTTVGIPVQEGIIGGIARGIKTTFDQALTWARAQVESIVATLQEALNNFISGLGDVEIDVQVEQFLSDYAAWKAPQIANVTWSSAADMGTNGAITDILDAATSPELPGFAIDNMRVRVLPEESSSDRCKEYAGKDYGIDEYQALGVSWPAHPNCPHYAEIYMGNGSENARGEML